LHRFKGTRPNATPGTPMTDSIVSPGHAVDGFDV
jgi:hypothetical protein